MGQEAAYKPISLTKGAISMQRSFHNCCACLPLEAGKGGTDARTSIAAEPKDLQDVFAESEESGGKWWCCHSQQALRTRGVMRRKLMPHCRERRAQLSAKTEKAACADTTLLCGTVEHNVN